MVGRGRSTIRRPALERIPGGIRHTDIDASPAGALLDFDGFGRLGLRMFRGFNLVLTGLGMAARIWQPVLGAGRA